MKTVLCSSLLKLWADSPLPPPLKSLPLFFGERGNLQLFVQGGAKERRVCVRCAAKLSLYAVKEMPSAFPIFPNAERCTLLRSGAPGAYPDLLLPLTPQPDGSVLLPAESCALWIEADTAGLAPGAYPLTATVPADGERADHTLTLRVGKTPLQTGRLIHTNWFHADCLADHYGVPVFSEAHWEIIGRFMENAAAHGVNCILTPLFTPPLDTAVGAERPTVQLVGVTKKGWRYTFDFTLLERWMALAEKHGITRFEFSHLFTQWGAAHAPKIVAKTAAGERRIFGWETDSLSAAYRGFLRQFGAALTAFTEARGVTERCFVHCSDEPGAEHIRRYRACAKTVHEYFGAFTHIDALSDPAFFKQGLVQLPVPEEGSLEAFAPLTERRWTYYCCGQFNNELPNRFFAMPSIRNRILGVLLYKYGCEGFLQWGFDFYYTQHSVRRVDPFAETDAGGAFPSGDSFIVYPGENGTPLPSLRQKVFYDAVQDYAALLAAQEKTSREAVLSCIGETLGEITFRSYPMEIERFEAFRARLQALCG